MQQITFIVGYYGSGKSEIAVNLAIHYHIPYLCDLDVVNPYFRSRSLASLLQQHNVKVVSSIEPQAIYLDMPLLSNEIIELFKQNDQPVIYDLGGSDLGSKIIRQFDVHQKACDLWFVINVFRDKTNTVDKILHEINMIETQAGMKITGLINNSNLLQQTTDADIIYGEDIIKTVVQQLHVPIVFTTISKDVKSEHVFAGEKLTLQMYLQNKTNI